MFDYAESSSQRWSGTQGRMLGSSSRGLSYPDPFFDVAHTFLPDTIKKMFCWCRYYYLTNPIIAAAVNKMAEYPITDILIDSENEGLVETWKDFFDNTLQLRSFMIDVGLYYQCYGNAIISIFYPFVKFLKCRGCGKAVPIKGAKYKFYSYKFLLDCSNCRHNGEADAEDRYIKSPNGIKLILWNPEDISIKHNVITGKNTYYYSIPRAIINDITIGKKETVEELPQIFIDGVRQQKAIVLASDNVFHYRRPSVLTNPRDRGWGIPILLPVLKDTFYLQILKKANEAIALERVYPLTVLFPQQTGTTDPLASMSLTKWRDQVTSEIHRWRQDRAYIPIMPVAIGQQVIGGDGRNLLLAPEIKMMTDQIIAGMLVPQEFIWGGLQWCLTGFSRISTVEGLRYLKDVVKDDELTEVLTEDGPRKITALHKVGLKPALKLRTKRGFELVGAGTHPVMVLMPDLSLKYVDMSEIEEGDYVVTKRGSSLWPDRPAVLPSVRSSSREMEVQLPERVTVDVAVLFGYITSEGNLRDDRFNFVNTELDVMIDFVDRFSSVFGFEPNVQYRESHKAYIVDVSRKHLCRFLEKCGVGELQKDREVPPSILRSPPAYVGAYLAAYFEGDGGVSFKNTGGGFVRAVTASESIARDVQLLLLNLGILSSRYPPTKASPCYKIDITTNRDLVKFREMVGFRCKNKKAKLDILIDSTDETYSDPIPYVRDVLRMFRTEYKVKSGWRWKPFEFEATQDFYSVKEVCTVLDRGVDQVRDYIKDGKLSAERVGKSFRILGQDLEKFCHRYGKCEQTLMPRLHKGATRHNMRNVDLSMLKDKDSDLYSKLKVILDSDFVFDEVDFIEDQHVEMMYDLTVEGTHSYIANGLITHNSGSNVSLRMLENQFMRDISNHVRMMRTFLVPNVSTWLGWPSVNSRFKKFKMADDLQHKAYLFQMQQARMLSKSSIVSDVDYDPIKEEELIQREMSTQAEATRKEQLAQAEMQGEAQVVMAKYQAKAQAAQQREMMQAQQGTQASAPGEPGEGIQGQPTPMMTPQGQPADEVPQAAPNEATAQQIANQLSSAPPENQQQILSQIAQQDPAMAQMVASILQGGSGGGSNGANKPLPEQLPPRRGPSTALV